MAIREELLKVTGMRPGPQDDEQTFLTKIVRAVGNLDDASWEALSEEAQDWFDSAADAFEQKKPIPALPAAEPEPEPEPVPSVRRRRGSSAETEPAPEPVEDAPAAEEPEPTPEPEAPPAYKLSVGDVVVVTTKRGTEYQGELMEFDDSTVYIKIGNKEETVRRASIAHVELVKTRTEAKAEQSGKPAPATKPPAEKPATKPPVEKPAASEKPATPRAGSVTQGIREMICSNPDASKDEIDRMCQQAGLEYRKSTIDIMFADTSATIRCLRELGKMA